MGESAKVDIEATVEFFRAAVDFDWTWGVEDVQRFSQIVGWKPADFGTESTIVMLTKAPLEKPFARFQLFDGTLNQVVIHLTDAVESLPREVSVDTFAAASASLNEILGAPILRVTDGDQKIFWKTSKFIGELVMLDGNVLASVFRPDYWMLVEELQARGIEL
ncbi:DUF6301 family protein [Nocardia sp. CA-128927]|uniref:DUF6301 family protein n=1 Tax=Nocardia sp. CA-128927 TaxID=3239975 RepID=UPI003D96D145